MGHKTIFCLEGGIISTQTFPNEAHEEQRAAVEEWLNSGGVHDPVWINVDSRGKATYIPYERVVMVSVEQYGDPPSSF